MRPNVHAAPTRVQLPRSSTRLQRPWAHCRLLTEVRFHRLNAGFEGPIYPAGAVVDVEQVRPLVVIECAGPIAGPARGQRPILWILWRFEWETHTWLELARAAAINWEWAEVLRAPAATALHPLPAVYDVLWAGRKLADEVMLLIDQRLTTEPRPIQVNTWTHLYTRIGGRVTDEEGQ